MLFWIYIGIISWLSIGAISWVIGDDPANTKGEYIEYLIKYTFLGYMSLAILIAHAKEHSEWWNEPINKNGD